MKRIAVLFAFLLMTGCAYHNPLEKFRWDPKLVTPYLMASWHNIRAYGQPIHIYLEGDIDSSESNGQPTQNPTPKSDFWRQIAANDPAENVAYIGQPCQFVQVGCSTKDWGSARFSDTSVNSVAETVLSLMKKAGSKHAVLIGYAGGAQLAGLVALKYPEKISQVITVAGIWDYQDWAQKMDLPPFSSSIKLDEWRKKRNTLNQKHFVGENDNIVPPDLAKTWSDNVIVVKGATHNKGYEKIYPKLYGESK